MSIFNENQRKKDKQFLKDKYFEKSQKIVYYFSILF